MLNEQQIKEFIESIEYNPLPRDQYVRKTSIKTQLTGHHTVSGSDPDKYWLMDKKRISTNFHLRRDGQLVQLFGSKFYGYHLGLGKDDFEDINLPYKFLDPLTISVEIINWGPLVLRRKEWYNIYGGVVQDPDVQYYKGGFNGFTDFKDSILFSVLGILTGGGVLYITGMIGDFLFKKESMGGGDIKLLAGIGAFLGWQTALLVFFLAPL